MPTMRLLPRSTHLADKLIFLKQVPLCAHMTDQELIAFSQYLRLREYARGQIVFEQGDLAVRCTLFCRAKHVFSI
jgi:hypothetical protein